MGSYPALDIKAPQQPDLLEKYGQLQQLKALQQQQQMQQEEAPLRQQILQQQVQTGQQDAAARQALNAAYSGAVTKDENGNPAFDETKLAQGLANGPAAYKTPEVMKSLTDFHKEKVQLQTSVTDLRAKQDKMIGSAASAVKAANYDPTLAHSILDSLPPSPQIEQIRQQIDNPQALRQLIDGAIQNSPEQRQLGIEQSKADQQAANQDATRQQAVTNAQETARHNRTDEAASRQRISLEGARLNFEKSRQGTADSQAIEQQAQQIAKYDVKGLSQARNNPFSRAVMARVYEINPGYSDEGYATNQDFLSSKGKANAQVQSLNKLSAHLSELQQASDKAGFSPVGFTAAGKDLRLAEQLFSKEDVKFLSGAGVGTEGELNGLIEKIHSPVAAVRNDAINTLSKFTADAARQLGDQFERGTKLKFDPNQHFTPDTVNMLNKHGGTSARGVNPGSFKMTATGPNGHKIGSNDGTNWVDTQTGKPLE